MPLRVASLVLAALAATLLFALAQPAAAQIDPQTRDRVVPAAVQIAIVTVTFGDGAPTGGNIPVGSGTVVSPDGAILTNAHVVDFVAHRAELDRWEAAAAATGVELDLRLVNDRFLISVPDASGRPQPAYFAALLAQDRDLDLALLRVVEDLQLNPVRHDELDLAYVPLGDSDVVGLGDPVDVFGYPVVGGDSLTYTTGVISGFGFEDDSGRRLWLHTDATLSGGSSGGTAVNRAGELIGVPTQGSLLDCRPGDTNLDGQVTADDLGCMPIGGSIGQIRPVNLALGVLSAALAAVPDSTSVGDPSAPTGPPGDFPASVAARCAESPLYSEGTLLETVSLAFLYPAPGGVDADGAARVVVPGSMVRVSGLLVENGSCDIWPVTVLRLPARSDAGDVGPYATLNDTGFVSEVVFQRMDYRVATVEAVMYEEPTTASQPLLALRLDTPLGSLEEHTAWLLVEHPTGLSLPRLLRC